MNNEMVDPTLKNLIDARMCFEKFCGRYEAGAAFRIVDNGHTIEIIRVFKRDDSPPEKWTTRQKVDYAISMGLETIWDIARSIGVNPKTVAYHLDNINVDKMKAEKELARTNGD